MCQRTLQLSIGFIEEVTLEEGILIVLSPSRDGEGQQ